MLLQRRSALLPLALLALLAAGLAGAQLPVMLGAELPARILMLLIRLAPVAFTLVPL